MFSYSYGFSESPRLFIGFWSPVQQQIEIE